MTTLLSIEVSKVTEVSRRIASSLVEELARTHNAVLHFSECLQVDSQRMHRSILRTHKPLELSLMAQTNASLAHVTSVRICETVRFGGHLHMHTSNSQSNYRLLAIRQPSMNRKLDSPIMRLHWHKARQRTVAARRGWGRAIATLAPLADVLGASVLHPPIGAVARGHNGGVAIDIVTRFLCENTAHPMSTGKQSPSLLHLTSSIHRGYTRCISMLLNKAGMCQRSLASVVILMQHTGTVHAPLGHGVLEKSGSWLYPVCAEQSNGVVTHVTPAN